MSDSPMQQAMLIDLAQRLTDLQRRILQALKDKGPGLLLEVAVRVLKFPEDVAAPLREMQSYELIVSQTVSGKFGGELFSLTSMGERVLRLLNDPSFQTTQSSFSQQAPVTAAVPPAPVNPRLQEAELLNKLGDLAKEKGELEKAVDYYQQALSITRSLSAEATEGGSK